MVTGEKLMLGGFSDAEELPPPAAVIMLHPAFT
jgi:hypothetical protein